MYEDRPIRKVFIIVQDVLEIRKLVRCDPTSLIEISFKCRLTPYNSFEARANFELRTAILVDERPPKSKEILLFRSLLNHERISVLLPMMYLLGKVGHSLLIVPLFAMDQDEIPASRPQIT